MKPRSPAETGMLCLTGLIALALLIFGVHTAEPNGKSMVWLVLALSLGAGMVALTRALMFKRKTQAELAGGEQYRALAEEYRRLARRLGISRALLQVHLRKLEAAGLVSATIEVSEDGKAMKFYEVTPFVLHLTPEVIADAARTLDPGSDGLDRELEADAR